MADFTVSPPGAGAALQVSVAPGYGPTPDEAAWLSHVNAYAARLAALGAGIAGTAMPQTGRDRDRATQRLLASVDAVIGTSPPARDEATRNAIRDASWDEAILTERIGPAPSGSGKFTVSPVADKGTGLITSILIMVPDGQISDGKQQFKVQLGQVLTVVRAVLSNADEPPADQAQNDAAWYVRLQAAWRRLDPVEPPDRVAARLEEYLQQLLGIARIGLMRADPTQVQLATLSLTAFKEDFVTREAGKIKNRYVRRLGVRALVALAIAAVLFLMTKALGSDYVFHRFQNFLLLAAAAAAGTWLSFSIRRPILSFADLDILEEDRLNPSLRILFMIGLTTVVGLILWTGMVVIEVGRFRSDFALTGSHAVLIGALCGIAERSLSGAVGQRATQFTAGIGGNPTTAA